MFIHLGNEVMVEVEEIIAIFEEQPLLKNKKNVQFLKGHQEAGVMEDIGNLSKSIVITRNRIYRSPFSTLTLKKRLGTSYAQGISDPLLI